MTLELKEEQGFTIIELVMVVAIMGMLASIAIPTYQTMAAKARQLEAKGALSGMYIAEQSFFAEFQSYTQCLRQAGYFPTGSVRYYSVGFMSSPSDVCEGNQTCGAYNWNPLSPCDWTCADFPLETNDATSPETASGGLPLINTCGAQSAAGVPMSWDASSSNFLVGAAGSISTSSDYDMWQIDNDQNIVNVQSGL